MKKAAFLLSMILFAFQLTAQTTTMGGEYDLPTTDGPNSTGPIEAETLGDKVQSNASHSAIYPSPQQIQFSIINSEEEQAELRVLGNNGVVFQKQIKIHNGKNDLRIDLPSLPKGIYFLVIEGRSGLYSQKILLE